MLLIESQSTANRMGHLGKFHSGVETFGAQLVQSPQNTPVRASGVVFSWLQSNVVLKFPSLLYCYVQVQSKCIALCLEPCFISLLQHSHFRGGEEQFQAWQTLHVIRTIRLLLSVRGHERKRDGCFFCQHLLPSANLIQKFISKFINQGHFCRLVVNCCYLFHLT